MQLNGRRILYVEDHEDTRICVGALLKSFNYEVTAIGSAASALRMTENQRFDLYLLDSWLPDMSGFDLCRKLREFDAYTPIVFYSAAVYEADKQRAFECGAQAYIAKPDGVYGLVQTIVQLISCSQTTAAH